jgi:hypothetical protein
MEQNAQLFSVLQPSPSEKISRFLLQKLRGTLVMGLWVDSGSEERRKQDSWL